MKLCLIMAIFGTFANTDGNPGWSENTQVGPISWPWLPWPPLPQVGLIPSPQWPNPMVEIRPMVEENQSARIISPFETTYQSEISQAYRMLSEPAEYPEAARAMTRQEIDDYLTSQAYRTQPEPEEYQEAGEAGRAMTQQEIDDYLASQANPEPEQAEQAEQEQVISQAYRFGEHLRKKWGIDSRGRQALLWPRGKFGCKMSLTVQEGKTLDEVCNDCSTLHEGRDVIGSCRANCFGDFFDSCLALGAHPKIGGRNKINQILCDVRYLESKKKGIAKFCKKPGVKFDVVNLVKRFKKNEFIRDWRHDIQGISYKG